jgi:CRP-like cAMP-binding protein
VLAFVVVDGMLSRETLFGDHVMFELLGATDVVRAPATADGALRGGRATLTAVTESVLLALGTSFVRATAQWPALMTAILDRLEAQRARVAIQGLIMHFPRAEDRLLLTLWHLGGRWGFPNGRGTVVPLPLTHAFLGWLTAASRPTVTVAVRMLEADGLVERLDDGSWLLREAVEQKVAQLSRPHVPHPLGEWLMVRHLHSDTAQASRALIAEAEQLSRRTQAIRARSLPD